jgi:hypothetical protein
MANDFPKILINTITDSSDDTIVKYLKTCDIQKIFKNYIKHKNISYLCLAFDIPLDYIDKSPSYFIYCIVSFYAVFMLKLVLNKDSIKQYYITNTSKVRHQKCRTGIYVVIVFLKTVFEQFEALFFNSRNLLAFETIVLFNFVESFSKFLKLVMIKHIDRRIYL